MPTKGEGGQKIPQILSMWFVHAPYIILAPVVSDSKTKSGNGLSEIDILQQF